MFIIAWLIFFVLLFLFFRYYTAGEQGSYQIKHGVVTITPDENGHYYIDGRINEHPVKFLIDTGASLIAIPQKLAKQLKLSGRYNVSIQTASGEVTGSLTRLQELSFAEFTIKDVKAVIIPGSDDEMVLLGMNVLSKFNLLQQNKQLIIQPASSPQSK
ncbi:MAG: retroviral-like aspartic protease family protein [Tatlockia sp.]|nr:retroviral-like aspartic protease family protein [Tatlockia sp.]